MKNKFLPILFLIFIAVVATPKIISLIKGPAPTPTMFDDAYSLDQAVVESESTGKPILVLATADWCPPCQALKRGALADPKVVEWVKANTIPVYLEDGANQDQLRTLPLKSYPTTFIIQEGQILGQFSGNISAPKFLKKIQTISNQS